MPIFEHSKKLRALFMRLRLQLQMSLALRDEKS